MNISLVGEGLLDPRQLDAWTKARQEQLRRAVAKGMTAGGKVMADKANVRAVGALNVRRRNFPGFRAKVYADKRDQMPMLRIYSKIPWLGIHEHGGRVSGPLLIPLNQKKRVGYKAFKRIVSDLMRGGNAFFKKVNGKVILFAENQPEFSSSVARFKRPLRKGLGGGRIKRGAEIPIAVLVPGVQIRAKLGLGVTVRKSLPQLAAEIERAAKA